MKIQMDEDTECKGNEFQEEEQIDVVESTELDGDSVLFSSESTSESSVNLCPIEGASSDSSQFVKSDMIFEESMNPFHNEDTHSDHVKLDRLRTDAKNYFNVLTTEEEEKWSKAIEHNKHPKKRIAELGAEVVHQESLKKLGPRSWLNDEIINFMMYVFQQREVEHKSIMDDGSSLLFFCTQFYASLVQGGVYDYGRVKNWHKFWGKTLDIFSFTALFIPVNLGGMSLDPCFGFHGQEKNSLLGFHDDRRT